MTRRLDEPYAREAVADVDVRVSASPPDVDEPATGQEAGWSGSALRHRILRPRTLLSFGVAVAIVAIVFARFDLNLGDVAAEMARANPLFLLGAAVAYYGSFAFRAARWRSLLQSSGVVPDAGPRRPRLTTLTGIFVLSWFVNCLVPAKLGDAYRGYLLKQREKAAFTGALGTIFAERLADLGSLALFLVASSFLVFGRHVPQLISSWLLLAVAVGALLVVGVAGVVVFRHRLRSLMPIRVREHYVRIEEGAFGAFGRLPALVGLTMIIWLLEGVRLYFVSLSVGAGLTVSAALFVALLASLLTVIPVTPAGLGFVEFGVVSILALLGVVQQTAASVALLDRVVAYWSVIVIGAVLYLVTRWLWR